MISQIRNSNIKVNYSIDPGFINYRKCFSCFGKSFLEGFNRLSSRGNSHLDKLANDHLMVELALKFCSVRQVKTLGEILANPQVGEIFTSTHSIRGRKDVYTKGRARVRILLPYSFNKKVFLEFSTTNIVCDTGRSELSDRSVVTIIGEVHKITQTDILIHPLVMGAPILDSPENREVLPDLWLNMRNWYFYYPEDIDEFSRIKEDPIPTLRDRSKYMSELSESDAKKILCEMLNEPESADWPGELNDIFTCALHINGKRISTAFLLKGPAGGKHFKKMTPDMLGARADQIYRLACTPAELLVVQHCHVIGETVRATLRVFAENPSNPRKYCFIEGKDTYRILKSYNKLSLQK